MSQALLIIGLVIPVVVLPLVIGHLISNQAKKTSDRHWDDYEAFHDRVNCNFQELGLPPLDVPRDRQDVFIWKMGSKRHVAELQAFRTRANAALRKLDRQNGEPD